MNIDSFLKSLFPDLNESKMSKESTATPSTYTGKKTTADFIQVDEKRITDKYFQPILEATDFLIKTIKRVGLSKFNPSMSSDGVKLYYVYIPETSSCRVDLRFADYYESFLERSFRGWKGGYIEKYGTAGHVYLDFPCESSKDISTFGHNAHQALKEITLSSGKDSEWCFDFIDWYDA